LKSQNVVQQQPDGSYAAGPGWVYGFDHSTQTPYVFNGENSTKPQLISYDDPYSLQLKRSYAKSLGMNGMMFWAMYGDTDDGELTQILT
jgi:GH18 family chitinase